MADAMKTKMGCWLEKLTHTDYFTEKTQNHQISVIGNLPEVATSLQAGEARID
jgi:hypothetical protein